MSISYLNAERYADPTAYEALKNIERSEKRQFRPLVYVCSPYSRDIEANTEAARRYCRFAVDKGYIPVAPHLLYPQFLDDTDDDDRNLGLFFGNVLMGKCHEVWVFGSRISSGMEAEITRAKRKNYMIRHFSTDLKEVTEHER